ncbi:hypothetical protein DSO57_1025191 [Entomophthora muscae]|uniref:Uncharacterized protein n=1 Tax=Entomophthora muscae TaxID=34485 RepID=A0ACC2UBW4_9FUNG|nr:hypothetical protein DSO57_1025191 [Entomophthora muscae]
MGFCSRGILHLFAFLADPMIFNAIPKLIKPDPEGPSLKFYQIEISSECNFSYHNLTGPSSNNTPASSLQKMIQAFQNTCN